MENKGIAIEMSNLVDIVFNIYKDTVDEEPNPVRITKSLTLIRDNIVTSLREAEENGRPFLECFAVTQKYLTSGNAFDPFQKNGKQKQVFEIRIEDAILLWAFFSNVWQKIIEVFIRHPELALYNNEDNSKVLGGKK